MTTKCATCNQEGKEGCKCVTLRETTRTFNQALHGIEHLHKPLSIYIRHQVPQLLVALSQGTASQPPPGPWAHREVQQDT